MMQRKSDKSVVGLCIRYEQGINQLKYWEAFFVHEGYENTLRCVFLGRVGDA